MVVNLADPDSNEDVLLDDQAVLSGQSVSSMYKLKDVTDEDGGFFCFGDLSAKIEGEYRLKFTLFEIVTTGAAHLMHVFSDVFRVYNAKSMPQLMDATFLSRSFSDQGVRIRIRKEHRVQV
ncbi:velvet factor [Gongronella butleri]|nr:velvet factor [Gongronella butleri]